MLVRCQASHALTFLGKPWLSDVESFCAKLSHRFVVDDLHILAPWVNRRWTLCKILQIHHSHLINVHVGTVVRFSGTPLWALTSRRVERLVSTLNLVKLALIEVSQVANRAES